MSQPNSNASNKTDVSNFYLARQAVLDAEQKVFAYELLYRSEKNLSKAVITDDLMATSTVIVNALSQFGLTNLIYEHSCFINVSSSFIMNEAIEVLPPDKVILDILEDVAINDMIIGRCMGLKKMGFRLALNKFNYRSEYDKLLPILDYIKISISEINLEDIPETVALIQQYSDAILIAEAIEVEKEFDACKQFGFSYFQGYHFEKPYLLHVCNPSTPYQSLTHLMDMLIEDANLAQIELEFKKNRGLVLGIYQLIHSSGKPGKVHSDSLHEVLLKVGKKNLIHWVQLLLLAYQPAKQA